MQELSSFQSSPERSLSDLPAVDEGGFGSLSLSWSRRQFVRRAFAGAVALSLASLGFCPQRGVRTQTTRAARGTRSSRRADTGTTRAVWDADRAMCVAPSQTVLAVSRPETTGYTGTRMRALVAETTGSVTISAFPGTTTSMAGSGTSREPAVFVAVAGFGATTGGDWTTTAIGWKRRSVVLRFSVTSTSYRCR